MRTVLIAEVAEDLRNQLRVELSREYCVYECTDGGVALQKLRTIRPDILIISLMLPQKDGFAVLRESKEYKPPIILCTTTYVPQYVEQTARELGVGYIALLPCDVHAIVANIEEMIIKKNTQKTFDTVAFVETHLKKLQFAPKWCAYKRLCVCIPRFAQDMEQSLTKELYPDTAKICNANSWKAVESSIRKGINKARKKGNTEVWKQYFPEQGSRPTNDTFIRTLATLLRKAREEIENT